MRLAFAVFCLLIAYVASYPSLSESAADDEDFELELRSILNDRENERMARSFDDDEEDSDDEESSFSKRNKKPEKKIDAGLACEIKCVHAHRNPKVGKPKTIPEAAKICKNQCPVPSSAKKSGQKKTIVQRKDQPHLKATREFIQDDDDINSSEEQQAQRRELYDYLMEQLQQNNNE